MVMSMVAVVRSLLVHVFSRFTYCPLLSGATEEEIKDRYTKLAQNWYPDRPGEKDNSVVSEVRN